MKLIKTILLATALLASSSSFANSPFSQTTITGVIVHDFGTDILVSLQGNVANSESCGINYELALEKSHPSFKEMYAAILAAFHANTKITGWVNGCHSFGMPKLTRLDLVK